ncbi:MAG: PASTA domain-containing protein [Treponema sp.]|jgi:cell division protein FtsI (penicillin-binding protein 3)|nr:PASTA domain-containing protein [Treponema sp.]
MKGGKRFIIFISLFSLAALAVLVRYGTLMLGPRRPEPAPRSRRFTERGPIKDRNGRVLALQTRLANISAWRPEIVSLAEFSRELAPLLEIPEDEITERIRLSSSDFVYLRKQVDESTIRMIEGERSRGRLRGIGIEPVVGRIYPERNLASQIIGFTGNGNDGLAGIEYAFNGELTSSPERPDGSQVYLTIDANVQHILEGIAAETLRENNAEAVMFLAADPRSGDILGSASLPGFDPNSIRDSSEEARMDRPAIWAYEPGSVFKVFSLSALMDGGSITGNTTFLCNGYYERTVRGGETIRINCLGAHGRVRAREIIIYSCNAGAAYAVDRMESGTFSEFLENFGFGRRTGAGNPGETAGFLRVPERWSERSKPTIAMGQELAVSALQMVQAATAVANDGILVPPRIISKIVSADGKTERKWENGASRRVLRPETAQAMRSYMVDVTSDIGTGWRTNVEDLPLAVKTGTAQIIDPLTGAYSGTDFIASCIALLPAESPSLILYLVIVKPRGEYFGGRIAAPPIRQAAEALVDYLGIPRGRNPQVDHPSSVILPRDQPPRITGTVPDFTGLSKRTLLPLLLRDDLHIEMEGDGWVRRQSPPPGSPVNQDTVIRLELE